MIRIYYWFEGVDPDRPGGPWWYFDFMFEHLAKNFVRDLQDRCEKMYWLNGHENWSEVLPYHHDSMKIYPPKTAKLIHTSKG